MKVHFFLITTKTFPKINTKLIILQPRSESCAWQWGGEVIVLVIILIQEIHLLHAEEWQTLWEETGKIGYAT